MRCSDWLSTVQFTLALGWSEVLIDWLTGWLIGWLVVLCWGYGSDENEHAYGFAGRDYELYEAPSARTGRGAGYDSSSSSSSDEYESRTYSKSDDSHGRPTQLTPVSLDITLRCCAVPHCNVTQRAVPPGAATYRIRCHTTLTVIYRLAQNKILNISAIHYIHCTLIIQPHYRVSLKQLAYYANYNFSREFFW